MRSRAVLRTLPKYIDVGARYLEGVMKDIWVEAAGVRCCISLSGAAVTPDAFQRFQEQWSSCASPALEPAVQLRYVVSPDPAERAAGLHQGSKAFVSIDNACDVIVTDVTLAIIEHADPELFLLHAAAVAHPQTGDVIGLIGPSGAGKSTAVLRLSRDFSYVTDELLAVEWPSRKVLPVPKPVARLTDADTFVKQLVGPDELLSPQLPDNVSLRRLYVLSRDDHYAAEPVIEPLDVLEAVSLCVPQISYLMRRSHPATDLAALLGLSGGVARVRYRDAAQLPELFATELNAPAAPSVDIQVADEAALVGEKWRVRADAGSILVEHL
ncbi:MAG: hypothetical protein ACOYBP_04425 [Microbacteriaceae bacterium]